MVRILKDLKTQYNSIISYYLELSRIISQYFFFFQTKFY